MADTPSVPFWFTVASSMLTFMGGLLSGQVSEFFKIRREREAREEARRLTNLDRRSQFQRDTLLALQTKASTLTDSYIIPLIYIQQAMKEQGENVEYSVTLPEDILRNVFTARFDMEMLASRVTDEAIRKSAFQLMALNPIEVQPKTQLEVQANSYAYGKAVSDLMSRIGIVLRSLDDAEIATER